MIPVWRIFLFKN